MNLFFTVSGLRGKVFETLTPEYVLRVSAAFFSLFNKNKVLVARDTRPSGKSFFHSVSSAAISLGKDIYDGKIAPTPSLVYSVKERGGEAIGIVITASHNPPEWNALKFVHFEGRFLFEEEIERLKKEISFFSWPSEGANFGEFYEFSPVEEHLNGILSHPYILNEEIRIRNFSVGVDPGGGATSMFLSRLLREIGVQVFEIEGYHRDFEVNVDSVKDFSIFVKEKELDIGFALDADGDRLIVILKDGEILSEEDTLPLCLYYLLSKEKGDIVTNYSTTENVEDIAERFSVKVYRTKVGESNVIKKMIETGALYGGEGNGGVIVKNFNFTRDGIFASLLILSLLCELGDPREFKKIKRPRYRLKLKFPLQEKRVPSVFLNFAENINSISVEREDGIRVKTEEGFIHIRVSNTEPVLRVIMEAREKEVLEEWKKKIEELV